MFWDFLGDSWGFVTYFDVVGGELLAIDSVALMLASLQSSAIWMIPALVGLAGTGFYLIKFRTNKEYPLFFLFYSKNCAKI